MRTGRREIEWNFKGASSYISESKSYIFAASLIFVGGIIFGIVFSASLGFLDKILGELISKFEGLGMVQTIIYIFLNNVWVSFLGLFAGVILGIFPVLNILSNGVVLGYVMRVVADENGLGRLWMLFPHGVFEIPAILISVGLGIKLGMFVFSKNALKEFSYRARMSFIAFAFVVLPLLVLAAVIEGILIFVFR